MKKKSYAIVGAVASVLALGAGVMIPFATSGNVAYAESENDEIYYVNSNQISMTKDQYDTLNTIGFNDSEIDKMAEEKFNKLMSMEFLHTQHETSIVYDGDDVSNTEADDNLGDILENAQQTTVSTMSSGRKFSTSDGTKEMDTYVSFAKVASGYKIYVKQNVNWYTDPAKRYTDILSIRYTNNIRVADYNGYPDVEMHLNYHKTVDEFKNTYKKHSEDDVIKSYTGKDTSAYEHKLGDYIAFQFALPSNSWEETSKIIVTTYDSFHISMETTFDTNFSNLTGTEMQSYYVHQTDSGHIDWGKLSFMTTPPYIEYSTSFWVDDPGFETALFRSISIEFDPVWLSRC